MHNHGGDKRPKMPATTLAARPTRQPRLPVTRKAVREFWQKQASFQERNLQAASIIAADPARYPGLMQAWATLTLSRAAERRAA